MFDTHEPLKGLLAQDGTLSKWPKKKHKQMLVLSLVSKQFTVGQKYSEAEVNEIVAAAYTDYALVRRELVVAGLIKRTSDGALYWREDNH